jgi:uncharacterized membrane protein YjfL (UPF0719 family)
MLNAIVTWISNIEPITWKVIIATIAPIWGLILMRASYRLFDSITPFVTANELKDRNIAVAIVVGSNMLGIGICVGLITGFHLLI